MQGPHVKKLIAWKMSWIMIPPGSGDGKRRAFEVAINALTKPGNTTKVAKEATDWVSTAILAVRQAADPNPWRTATDDAIAAEILNQAEKKRRGEPMT